MVIHLETIRTIQISSIGRGIFQKHQRFNLVISYQPRPKKMSIYTFQSVTVFFTKVLVLVLFSIYRQKIKHADVDDKQFL